MRQYVEVNSFKQAVKVVEALTDSGYQVLVHTDNHYHPYQTESGWVKEKTYQIEYVHTEYEGDWFMLSSECEQKIKEALEDCV